MIDLKLNRLITERSNAVYNIQKHCTILSPYLTVLTIQLLGWRIIDAKCKTFCRSATRGHGLFSHDDVIKWKNFPRYWPFVRGIRRSPVKSPHKGQWRETLMFSLICTRIKCWVNSHEAGDLRRYFVHYDVIVMGRAGLNGKTVFPSIGIPILESISLQFYFQNVVYDTTALLPWLVRKLLRSNGQ